MILDDLLLALCERPLTCRQLGQALGVGAGQLEAALQQLQRGGYVDRAIPDRGACQTGCGMCSMKNLCPSRAPGPVEPQESWRLTDKARVRVRPPA
ncbi:hypothetical protein IV102_15025 [bacterium]|nr:hypothetical protein [bacterium]